MNVDGREYPCLMPPARMMRIQAVFPKFRAIDHGEFAIRELHRAPDRAVTQAAIPSTRHDHANQSPYLVYGV